MTSLTINIGDEVAKGLLAEAVLRHVSIEQVAAERVAFSSGQTIWSPTPAIPPRRLENPEDVIGSFADRPDLIDSVLAVVDDRARRYSVPE